MKYGILGGTFDPPHNGHLALGRAAMEQLGLDEVMFVPVNRNPLKTRKVTKATVRLEMVELAIQDEPGFTVSDIEISRGGSSYSVDTLEELHMVLPGSYWFVVGADALQSLDSWKDPEKLLSLCRIAAVAREGLSPESVISSVNADYSRRIDIVTMPEIPVSSSQIRTDIYRRMPVERWLKPAVWEYIKKVGLYRE